MPCRNEPVQRHQVLLVVRGATVAAALDLHNRNGGAQTHTHTHTHTHTDTHACAWHLDADRRGRDERAAARLRVRHVAHDALHLPHP